MGMAVKVIVPSRTYSEKYLGVQFENGEAVFEDEALAKSIAEVLGYKIEKIEAEKPEPKKPAKRAAKKVEG